MCRAVAVAMAGGLMCALAVGTQAIEAAPAQTNGAMRNGAFPGRSGTIALTTRKPSPHSVRYIQLVDPDGGKPRYIGPGYAPAWSPDGTRILFLSAGELAVMRADGSDKRVIGDGRGDSGHDWSPDGRRIVVAWDDGIWVLRADGTRVRRLLGTAAGKFAYEDVRWSPNGSHIAFTRYSYADDARRVFSVRVSGGSISPVSVGGVNAQRPSWAPDSKRIAYVEGALACRDPAFVAIAMADGSSRTLIATIKSTALDRGCGRSDVAWSPDGRRIAFTDGGWLRLTDIDGSNGRLLVPLRETPYDGALSWQPLT